MFINAILNRLCYQGPTQRKQGRKGYTVMSYTDETRKKLETILEAFDTYIEGQNYFDIVYSKKIGYVWILADHPEDAGAVQLDTPEIMLDLLFNEIINDVINSPENRFHIPESHILTEWEQAEIHRRISVILDQVGDDKTEYLEYLDEYIRDHQKRYAGFDELR